MSRHRRFLHSSEMLAISGPPAVSSASKLQLVCLVNWIVAYVSFFLFPESSVFVSSLLPVLCDSLPFSLLLSSSVSVSHLILLSTDHLSSYLLCLSSSLFFFAFDQLDDTIFLSPLLSSSLLTTSPRMSSSILCSPLLACHFLTCHIKTPFLPRVSPLV